MNQDFLNKRIDAEMRLDHGMKPIRSLPPQLTRACHSFLNDYYRVASFVRLAAQFAAEADELSRAQAATQDADNDQGWTGFQKEFGIGAESAFYFARPVVLEMLMCRCTDNFVVYMTDLLTRIYRAQPELLQATEPTDVKKERDDLKVALSLILEHKTMEDLIHAIADERVHRLSYRSMRELLKFFSKQFKFRLFPDDKDANRIVRIVEVRNLLVHSRGIVNRQFLQRLPKYPTKVGERLQLDPAELQDDIDFLAASGLDIDARAIKHFRLPHWNMQKSGREGPPDYSDLPD